MSYFYASQDDKEYDQRLAGLFLLFFREFAPGFTEFLSIKFTRSNNTHNADKKNSAHKPPGKLAVAPKSVDVVLFTAAIPSKTDRAAKIMKPQTLLTRITLLDALIFKRYGSAANSATTSKLPASKLTTGAIPAPTSNPGRFSNVNNCVNSIIKIKILKTSLINQSKEIRCILAVFLLFLRCAAIRSV